jgi:VWFA-related protein
MEILMRRGIAILVCMLLLYPPGGTAQNPPPPQKETPAIHPNVPPPPPTEKPDKNNKPLRVFTDLVQIDAQVNDRSGKTVKGLKPDQFIVLEDGKPQTITTFEYSDVETLETAGADAQPIAVTLGDTVTPEKIRQTVRDHRLIVLFFDLTSLQPPDLLRSAQAALNYLHKQMSLADLVAIVTFGNRLTVVTNFTNDRALLERAVVHLRPGMESQLAGLTTAAAQEGEDTITEDNGDAYTPDETEFNIFNTDRKLAALESLAQLLRDTPGRKSVISFTSGVTQTGQDNRTQLRATTDAANRADASFYTVDSRGLQAMMAGGDITSSGAAGTSQYSGAAVFRQSADRQDSRETLATLATDTGGRAFFDLGDFSAAFQQVQKDSSGYYLLGYYSANGKEDGRWRRVEVKVRAPGTRVRYRQGYYAPKAFGLQTAEDRERGLDEALRAENPVVELPLALETAQFRLGRNEIFVPIAAKVGSSALDWAEHHGRREAEFDFAAEVRERTSSHTVAVLRDTIKVQLDPERYKEIQLRPLVYQGGVILGPGSYQLKFVARENASGRVGTFEQPLLIAAEQADRLELSSLVLSSQSRPASEASAEKKEVQRKAQEPDAKLRKSPLEISGEQIIPSVTRVFSGGQTLTILFQAYPPAKVDASKLRAGLVFFREGERASETALVEPAEWDAKTRTAAFRFRMPLAALPAGRYSVEAVAVESGGSHAGFARQSFALRPAVAANSMNRPPTGPLSASSAGNPSISGSTAPMHSTSPPATP